AWANRWRRRTLPGQGLRSYDRRGEWSPLGSHHQSKEALGIRPPGFQPESGGGKQFGDAAAVVLATDLRSDRFAGREMHQAHAWNPDPLLQLRNQVHFDSVIYRLVKRQMLEGVRIEVRAQL